jgi:predicted transcriptional regulator
MPNIEEALKVAGKNRVYSRIVDYLCRDHDWHVSREIEHVCYLPQPQVSLTMATLIGEGIALVQMKRKEPSKGRPVFEYKISEEAEKKLFMDLREDIEEEYKAKIAALEEV